jgi:5-formyltetrahydrofolate cyclo-ligase
LKSAALIDEAKRALRARMRILLAGLGAAERRAQSARISHHLTSAPSWSHAARLMGFVAMASEPDILSALKDAAAEGRVVALPRWNAGTAAYEAALLPGNSELVQGPFGVLEPPPDARTLSLERLDLVVVPGLAFDRCGRRLGRGKGFFDRLLTRARHARRWGVAFAFQVVDEVPTAPHDANLDVLVTPEFRLPMTARGST